MRKKAPRGQRLSDRYTAIPKRPYLSSAIFYGVLAGALVVVTWATGGGIVRAVIVAVVFFVVATAWNWVQFRKKLAERERR